MEKFLAILNQYRGKRVLALCHNDADSDALGSASVLAGVLGGDLAVPKTISEHARELQYKLKLKIVFQPDPADYDLTIIVDTADSQQLPGCMPREYLLIDHHPDNKLVEGAMAAVYELTDSTCQLVWKVCQALGERLDESQALALGAGIMGDTRYLATAGNATLTDLAGILQEGNLIYRDLLRVLRVTSKIEREVRLRAAFSAKLTKIGNCLVASTCAERNYVYYISMMLLELGADIAAVGYQEQEKCFIRLAKNPTTAHCLNLFAVLEAAVGIYSKTNLWGTPDYAGFNGEGRVEEIIERILDQLELSEEDLGVCRCADSIPVSP